MKFIYTLSFTLFVFIFTNNAVADKVVFKFDKSASTKELDWKYDDLDYSCPKIKSMTVDFSNGESLVLNADNRCEFVYANGVTITGVSMELEYEGINIRKEEAIDVINHWFRTTMMSRISNDVQSEQTRFVDSIDETVSTNSIINGDKYVLNTDLKSKNAYHITLADVEVSDGRLKNFNIKLKKVSSRNFYRAHHVKFTAKNK